MNPLLELVLRFSLLSFMLVMAAIGLVALVGSLFRRCPYCGSRLH